MVSIIALWVLVLFETGLLLLLLRALGELRQQRGFSATNSPPHSGLEIGEQAPVFVATDDDGGSVQLEDFRGKRCLLAFVSPDCPACAGAIETLNTVVHNEQDLAVLVIGGPDAQKNGRYAVEHHAQMPIWASSETLPMEVYRIRGIPFVFVLDERGIIRAKGPVNQLDHLQAMLNTAFEPVTLSR